MPWQRLVADTALEVLPSGEWAYPVVLVTVQRQAGKTSLLSPVAAHRCLTVPRAKAWYTAQSRTLGREKFVHDYMPTLAGSPLAPRLKFRHSNGSEEIAFPGGSRWQLFAPVADALHGTSNHLVAIDEAWAFDWARGNELEAAILPTFAAVDGQLWIVSTAGTAASTWLKSLVDKGREAAGAAEAEGLAYFEWAIADDADPADLDAVEAAHPAHGITLRRRALEAAQRTMDPGEFARAFGNRWTSAAERVVSEAAYRAACLGSVPEQPEAGAVVLAVDAHPDAHDAAIVVAWPDESRAAVVAEVVDARPGTDWVPARLAELCEKWRPAWVVYDRKGPARHLVAEAAESIEFPSHGTSAEEYADACGSFLKDLGDRLRLVDSPELAEAAASAAKRRLGESWAWGRRASGGSISPVVGATLGYWGARHAPEPPVPFAIL